MTAQAKVESEGESRYRQVIVPMVRGVVGLIVVVFVVGGVSAGVQLGREDPDQQLLSHRVECAKRGYSGDNAEDCPLLQDWNVPLAVFGGGAGGAAGLAAGLFATFIVEVQVTVFLAARKYLST